MSCERGPMHMSTVDLFIHHYVYPCQLAFLLTATILGSRELFRSRSRLVARALIIFLAIADLCLMATVLPQSLATFSWFYENETCRRFVHYTKISINAWSNVFSAAEVFFTVAICAECFFRAKRSKYAKIFEHGTKFYLMTVAIAVLSLLVTFYHFFLYELKTGYRCNGEKLVSKMMMNEFFTIPMLRFFAFLQGFVVIIVSCMLVTYFNVRLERYLNREKVLMVSSEYQELVGSTDSVALEPFVSVRKLRAITMIFILSHALSFVPFLYDVIPSLTYSELWPHLISVMNSALISGKLINLVLIYQHCKEQTRAGQC